MTKTWFTSDSHYHHKNMVFGVSVWEDKNSCRYYSTLEKHDEALIKNINDNVGENDVLYHLGDWSFGGIDNIWNFRKEIKCKNIHLILGNHDHHIEKNRLITPVQQKEAVALGYYNPFTTQSLFKSVQHYKKITIEKQQIILCHYAMRVWDQAHHGSWMLYGHSHNSLPEYKDEDTSFWKMKDIFYKTMDVGFDTHKEFRPYSFEEIKEIMSVRTNINVDHHNQNTN
jgi:calcineurin-like phosphoesterase family protein